MEENYLSFFFGVEKIDPVNRKNQHFKKNPPKNAKYFICKRFLELMVGDAL